MPELSIIDYLIWAVQRNLLQGESRYFDAMKSKYETVMNLYKKKDNKKAKKSFCPRASNGDTHHGMRYVGSKLSNNINILQNL